MFFSANATLPRIANPQRVASGIEDWQTHSRHVPDPEVRQRALALLDAPLARQFLESVFSNSPFLTLCSVSDIGFTLGLLESGPENALADILDRMKDELGREPDRDRLMRELRRARRETALLVAAADITGHWWLDRLTGALTDFADGAVSATVSHLLLQLADRGNIVLPDTAFPEDDCGYVVLAMGKHGARELNYSSDIDLIILYEPTRFDYRGTRAEQRALVTLTRDLVAIMSNRTAEGYVARVDLRLRPDPSATPIAVPYAAALSYYLHRAQHWERAAMIKARPVAGDLSLGRQFLTELEPFIWRQERDFWTLRSIQSIKQQINKQRGGDAIGFEGQNVKLGRGGIREIEFLAQTLQLIFGGRDPFVRCTKTVDALAALSEAGWMETEVAEDLVHGYEFLRTVEHRLQMVNDQQTQSLPKDNDALRDIAAFMGYESREAFRIALHEQLRRVDGHYVGVFDNTPEPVQLHAEVLTGPPELGAAHLRESGFRDGAGALALAGGWTAPNHPAVRDERGLDLLNRLVPKLLECMARGPDPDAALRQFDRLLGSVNDPIKLLSLLTTNPPLVELAADLAAIAPAVVDDLKSRPELLESALDRGFGVEVPELRLLRADCAACLSQARSVDEVPDRLERWMVDNRFPIVVGVARQEMNVREAGMGLGAVFEAALRTLLRGFMEPDRFDRVSIPTSAVAVVAFSRLADRNMTACSTAEFAFVLDDSNLHGEPDVAAAMQSVSRMADAARDSLARPLRTGDTDVNSLEATPAARGRTPVLRLSALLTRAGEADRTPMIHLAGARILAGGEELSARLQSLLAALAGAGLDRKIIADEFRRVRRPSHAGVDPPRWDLERQPGGLYDLRLLIDYLRACDEAACTSTRGLSLVQALELFVSAGLLDAETGDQLIRSARRLDGLQHFLHATLGSAEHFGRPGNAQQHAMARAAGLADFQDLEQDLRWCFETIDKALSAMIGARAEPAL